MIEEGYVSFNTVRMLEEVGFDAPYTSQYSEEKSIWHPQVEENKLFTITAKEEIKEE